jgi:ligand-binding SRPBCC domain-containing protein
MKIILKTIVKGHYIQVMEHFDKDLFEALKPPVGEMVIEEFTGSKKGDRVHLRFVSPISMEWISDITEHGTDDQEAYFIDEGSLLPYPLKSWTHRHIVRHINDNTCEIIDDISYEGSNQIWTNLLYPVIYLSFLPRKKVYKTYFDLLNLTIKNDII